MTDSRMRTTLSIASTGWWGALVGIGLGLALFALGLATALRADPMPLPLTIALCVAGALEASLCWLTMRRVRVAWAFATAIGGTAAVVFLFSAPKIRDALEVSLAVALVPAAIGAIVATLLATAAGEMSR